MRDPSPRARPLLPPLQRGRSARRDVGNHRHPRPAQHLDRLGDSARDGGRLLERGPLVIMTHTSSEGRMAEAMKHHQPVGLRSSRQREDESAGLNHEIRPHYSRWFGRRAARVARRQDAARGGQHPGDGCRGRGRRGGPGEQYARGPAGRLRYRQPEPVGLRPASSISPAGRRWRPPHRASNSGRTIGPSAAIWSRSKTR